MLTLVYWNSNICGFSGDTGEFEEAFKLSAENVRPGCAAGSTRWHSSVFHVSIILFYNLCGWLNQLLGLLTAKNCAKESGTWTTEFTLSPAVFFVHWLFHSECGADVHWTQEKMRQWCAMLWTHTLSCLLHLRCVKLANSISHGSFWCGWLLFAVLVSIEVLKVNRFCVGDKDPLWEKLVHRWTEHFALCF